VLYAGSWRILHDIPGNGVLYWTPMIVQALLFGVARSAQGGGGSSSPGVYVVLFSSIPYAAASLAHLANAWHAQCVGEVKLHIAFTWLLGAVALALLPFAAVGALSGSSASTSTGANITALALLTVAHVGVNGANGLQTGLVAGCLCADQKALGLAMYNTIACMGSFLGPLLIGIIHDATHGYRVAMWVLACCLAAAAFMVYRLKGRALQKW
jgi:ACS family tartrate transporter-like MFS transporter